MFIAVVAFIGVLALLVLAHEWGHFWAARRLRIAVDEFGFGFPPRLAAWRGQRTLYTLNWLPLGGFVKLKGEEGGAKGEPDSFAAQTPWRRAVVLVAGVTMNVVLAWLLLSAILLVGVEAPLGDSQLVQARNPRLQVVEVELGSPAAQAGLAIGDTVRAVDSTKVTSIRELKQYLAPRAGQPVVVHLERGGVASQVTATPVVLPAAGNQAALGVGLVQVGTISYPWYQALWYGAGDTYYLGRAIVAGFRDLFAGLFTHGTVPADIAGPVGIAVLTGQVVKLGFVYLLQFAALLSLNLAVINILPFPALDGGRLLFVVIEKVRRKPNNERIEALVHRLGFAILMVLVLLVTYRDVANLAGGFFSQLF